jgi:ATP-GRASP peptide maturase of grasp-with-spasm system
MIVIISSQNDASTNDIIFWLKSANKKFIRVNEEDLIKEVSYSSSGICVKTSTNKVINLHDVTGYWYRRGHLRYLINQNILLESRYSCTIINGVKSFKEGEINKLLNYIYIYLDQNSKSLTSYFQVDTNKLHILEEAKKCGLLVPNTSISTSREELKKIVDTHHPCITKPINEIFFVNENNTSYRSLTVPVTLKDVDEIESDVIFPMLIQEGIQKKLEIRVFFLLGVCYSMAIFSQSDSTTVDDFRNYNREKPNRCVPFTLPLQISYKINLLMNKLGYKTGSIDFLLDNKHDYYFLEINPVGQFGMVSFPCNYNIEKKIAEYLYQ